MATASEQSIRLAVRNVAKWGDTDVLPYPLENHWFHDAEDAVVDLLLSVDESFERWLNDYPVLAVRGLTSVGYAGFRPATQIDPIWNAYLLALCVELGAEIENARCPTSDERVFSYRYAPDRETGTLFDPAIGWHTHQVKSLERARPDGYVLATDISNFYPRVYHHRIENSLNRVTGNRDAVGRIMAILTRLSVGGVSYGLPVGGNAARILAEALLNRTDRLLIDRSVNFSRFVDDYLIFGDSEEDVRRGLVYLSDVLLNHEGLSLSRMKTRLMTSAEFAKMSPAAVPADSDSATEDLARRFLRIRLKYDPYSPTASEDFEKLSEELRRFDIVGMLAQEVRKSRIDESLTKQLVRSLRYLDQAVRSDAVDSLVKNFGVLFPIFPTVAIVIRRILNELETGVRDRVFATLRDLISSRSHISQVPANLAFAVRLLGHDTSEAGGVVLSGVYDTTPNMMVRRDAILAMAARGSDHWISDRLRDWSNLTAWERRALLPGSFQLGEEGAHWRRRIRGELNEVDTRFLEWVADKNNGAVWAIPV